MQYLIQAVTSDWLHIVIAAVIAGLFALFLFFVVLRGFGRLVLLRRIRASLKTMRGQDNASAKADLRAVFKPTPLLALWQEYEDTLHEQRISRVAGDQGVAIRATVPAETFFNGELVVESWLHAEFFKHLPGIFTGLGIIATFSGLIAGLQAFDVTAIDPEALKANLAGLFEHVRTAFYLSAVAIGLAMVSTIFEKFVYAANLHQTAGIAGDLDAMFRAGVGEEYLSELVRSSEESATQTRQLKESLVEDLKTLLTNLTERQIHATQQLSADIGAEMSRTLKEPLEKIAGTVDQASRDQTQAASAVLENLMTAFMTQMRDSLGGQMGELSAMMRQSAESMSQVEGSLRALVADMQQASRSSVTDMQQGMRQLLESLETHERQQRESSNAAQVQTLTQIQDAMERMVAAQEAATSKVNAAAEQASSRIGDASGRALEAGEQAIRMASGIAESVQQTSLEAVAKLEDGARQIAAMLSALDSATDRLGKAGGSLASLHEKAGNLGAQMERATAELGKSTQQLGTGSQALAQAAIRIEGVSGLMASEAGAREAAMREVQLALSKSQEAAREFADYSGMVTEKLEEAISKFGNSTVAVLDRSLIRFDKELGQAVELIGQTLERLTVVVADSVESRG